MEENCYICWEEESNDKKFLSKNICKCKSLRIHSKCFLKLTEKSKCSVCKEEYEDVKIQIKDKVLNIRKGGMIEDYSVDKYNRKHGCYKCFYPNGNIFIYCYYNRGLRDDLFRMYYPNMELKEMGYFDHGNRYGEHLKYYSNGNIMEVVNYEEDILYGSYEFYDKQGVLLVKGYNRNGVPHNTFTLYHSNGKKWLETNYKKGVLHGRSKEWNQNGELLYDMDYENDEYIGKHEQKENCISSFVKRIMNCHRRKKIVTSG
jgi:antitoxin component YwqK of YwqJK toxin-antitoxin module